MRWNATRAMVLAVLLAAGAGGQTTRPTSRPFVPAKETTVVTGPLRPDGTIDYVAALNELCAKGVTRENNAAVPLLEVIDADGERDASAISRERAAHGIKAAPVLLVPLRKFAQTHWKEGDGVEWNDADDKLDELTKGPWKAQQSPVTARWLKAIEEPLDRIVAGTKRERFDIHRVCDREPATVIHVEYVNLSPMRLAARALRARALLRLGAGDFEGFRNDTIAILRLGRLASQEPTLVEKLVAIGCQSLGLETLRAAADGEALSGAQCEQLAADLDALPPSAPLADCFATGERFMMLDYLVMCAVHGPLQAGRIMSGDARHLHPIDTSAKDWNAALRRTNGWYDRMVEAGRKPTYAERAAACAAIDADVEKLQRKWSGLAAPFAPIEDRMITILLPSVGRAYQAETRLDVYQDLTLLALALRAYHSREGRYPPKLEGLTPRSMKTLPRDRFNQQPLIYRPEGAGYVLYSVGPNGIDDRGESGGKKDDIAVRAGAAH